MQLALQHYRLYAFVAIARILQRGAELCGGRVGLVEKHPFLSLYQQELAALGQTLNGAEPRLELLLALLEQLECSAEEHLPLSALCKQGRLDSLSIQLLLAVGLVDDDARFGLLFSELQGTPQFARPTLGLLELVFASDENPGAVRSHVHRLRELGLLLIVNPDAPRSEWVLYIPSSIGDALRGESEREGNLAPGLHHTGCELLAADEPYLIPPELVSTWSRLPALLAAGELTGVVVRGPRHNGRRSLIRSLARELGRGILTLDLTRTGAPDPRCSAVGALATMLHAVPIMLLEPAPGETIELPELLECDAPIGIVLGRHGGIAGRILERSTTIQLGMPDCPLRRRHWQRAFAETDCPDLDLVARRYRLTTGHLRSVARLAQTEAAIAGRKTVMSSDVRRGVASLNRAALDTLATHIAPVGDWSMIAVTPETMRELRVLEHRCQERESLLSHVGAVLASQLTAGLRALFRGPSGTGKTLAARVLAASLEMDLYRVDLSSVVNKYIGETEKNLARLFALAEELDVILLFDEGDALFARRTGVASSNDRYANLETNYLLQRVESFEGILLITTNASDSIDSAFERRMDVLVDFRLPEAVARMSIWRQHLAEQHQVEESLLNELATRCQLTGGQIRNVVLHASLLALKDQKSVSNQHVEVALFREYKNIGAACPLRRASVASGAQ